MHIRSTVNACTEYKVHTIFIILHKVQGTSILQVQYTYSIVSYNQLIRSSERCGNENTKTAEEKTQVENGHETNWQELQKGNLLVNLFWKGRRLGPVPAHVFSFSYVCISTPYLMHQCINYHIATTNC